MKFLTNWKIRKFRKEREKRKKIKNEHEKFNLEHGQKHMDLGRFADEEMETLKSDLGLLYSDFIMEVENGIENDMSGTDKERRDDKEHTGSQGFSSPCSFTARIDLSSLCGWDGEQTDEKTDEKDAERDVPVKAQGLPSPARNRQVPDAAGHDSGGDRTRPGDIRRPDGED